jgi:hypothetical protein
VREDLSDLRKEFNRIKRRYVLFFAWRNEAEDMKRYDEYLRARKRLRQASCEASISYTLGLEQLFQELKRSSDITLRSSTVKIDA